MSSGCANLRTIKGRWFQISKAPASFFNCNRAAGSWSAVVLQSLEESGSSLIYLGVSSCIAMHRFQISTLEVLVGFVHLPSKLRWSDTSISSECQVLAERVRKMEQEAGHCRTILMGDFNLNPFEHGIVAANGFHATMDRSIAMTKSRIVQDTEYPFFYNPMWGCFGDRTPGPSGTFYDRDGGHISYDWNMLDPFLMRAELLKWFDEDVRVVDRTQSRSLLTRNGLPDQSNASDHLPVLLRINRKRQGVSL